jgi:hypothetical protein
MCYDCQQGVSGWTVEVMDGVFTKLILCNTDILGPRLPVPTNYAFNKSPITGSSSPLKLAKIQQTCTFASFATSLQAEESQLHDKQQEMDKAKVSTCNYEEADAIKRYSSPTPPLMRIESTSRDQYAIQQ